MLEDIFQPYQEFLKKLDALIFSVRDYYHGSIICAEGCSSCCIGGLSLFPVEADYIRTFAEKITNSVEPRSEHCRFLRNSRCIIYSLRPVVCRTQGMPLLYGATGSEPPELSLCELNFQGEIITNIISQDHLIDMDRINTILAAHNIHYLKKTGKLDEMPGRRMLIDEIVSSND